MKCVHLFTDGSCRGNPGPGGWAFLLRYVDAQGRGHERVESGAVPRTTNNRMELEAVIQGLAALREPCQVELYTDSQYVLTLLNGGRAHTNHDVVARLLAAATPHHLTLHYIRGHTGHPDNERVDALARQAATGVGRGRREEGGSPHRRELKVLSPSPASYAACCS